MPDRELCSEDDTETLTTDIYFNLHLLTLTIYIPQHREYINNFESNQVSSSQDMRIKSISIKTPIDLDLLNCTTLGIQATLKAILQFSEYAKKCIFYLDHHLLMILPCPFVLHSSDFFH